MFPRNENEKGESPVVVVQQAAESQPRKWSAKKYIVIGTFGVVLAGLILTGILVGMHMFTEAQKQLVEYTLKLKDGRSQDVTSDVTSNIVKYHVQDEDHEAWVVNDFNTDIKVTKIVTKTETSCYLTPLNRSTAMEPSKVKKPDDTKNPMDAPLSSNSVIYTISGKAVNDISFLNKDAKEMCKGVSTYWMYPSCDGDHLTPNNTQLTNNPSSKNKREAPYYIKSWYYYGGYYYPCINGCCKTVCACSITYSWNIINGQIYCSWITQRCCSSAPYCLYGAWCSATPGLTCTSGVC